ncbi:hypothetical protein FHS79_001429 [Polymorphobacter multimanifer]|uniref:Uncharacterized protein n=1 Tax=Polymorphobacter multimanifer TaxID=1070431 RepID=A0A841L8H2_9SPHN|nr:hypothetical protein [Polymorphobacter multimanifer]MBB6227263.1 hypothetical protein [Polymorphobacter multimanifer]
MTMRLALVFLLLPVPALAQPAEIDARTIVARAFEAAGGERWAKARSLELKGRAVFYGAGPTPRAVADDYRMWREFEDVRTNAHGEAGKVRIEARSGGKPMFLVGSDGSVSFNEKGIIPKAEADRFWANNFGFGVIRSALGPGFGLERLPDDQVGGHAAYMVRVTDPAGTATLFGIDKTSHFIRLAGFATPSGWHVRTYDDFVVADGWTQARTVTLYYNGVIANQVFWTDWKVNAPVASGLFQPSASAAAPG